MDRIIKIVIADTSVLFREGVKHILTKERDLLVVGEAGNENELLETLEETQPDVLLFAMEISDQKAQRVLLELKQKKIPVKVIRLSVSSETETVLDAAKNGARGYALKDIPPSTLLKAIRKVYRDEIWVDRRLNCAPTFRDLAQQARAYNFGELEKRIGVVLSKREMEVLALLADGLTNQEIGRKLFISLRTVKAHVNHLLQKLKVKNRTMAALLFLRSQRKISTEEVGIEYHKGENNAAHGPAASTEALRATPGRKGAQRNRTS